ncbi:MAG: flotillin family protein [Clostridia bacterium]|nr:flotillin family protein [Clostridia bacterium]
MTIGLIIAGVVLLLVVLICAFGYVKAPPDTAYIITGLGMRKVLVGKSGIRIPFLQRLDKLKLSIISVDVKTQVPVPTKEFINVTIDGVVTLQVAQGTAEIDGHQVNLMELAAKNFLNKGTEYYVQMVTPVLEGNAREIIGQMGIKEMVNDRKSFAEKVRDNAIPDLRRMGLELLTFNVQNFMDKNGVIDALGTENEVKVKQTAAIARAESEREITKAQAAAREESRAAQIAADTKVAEQENQLAIRQAELKQAADIKKAEADAAYSIQEQQQRRSIETETVNADIARREREAELAEREIALRERKLDADIKKKADAEKYRIQTEAEAAKFKAEKAAEAEKVSRQHEADAKKYEEEKRAEVIKLQAEAELVKQQKEAEGIQARGQAEAEAIKAKGLAEAEAIDRKAEAMQKYGEAAVLEMTLAALPKVAEAVAAPLGNVDKITMYGDGNSTKLVQEMITNMTQAFSGIQESTGLNVPQLLAGFLSGKAAGKLTAANDDDND